MSYKDKGNAAYAEKKYDQALWFYSQAIDKVEDENQLHIYHSNRSATYLQLGQYKEALDDAEIAICLQPTFVKGYVRKGAALEGEELWSEALDAYKEALDVDPMNKIIRDKVKSVKKKVVKPLAPPMDINFAGYTHLNIAHGYTHQKNKGFPNDKPAIWAKGIRTDKKYEWLVDCYRMRVDDLYVYQGRQAGLYTTNARTDTIMEDFLLFCKLAAERKAIPADWSWVMFLKTAGKLLPLCFDKAAAKFKYGNENVFDVQTGGRSLRYTAEMVYKSSVADGRAMDDAGTRVSKGIYGRWAELVRDEPAFLDNIGGLAAWIQLEKDVEAVIGNPKRPPLFLVNPKRQQQRHAGNVVSSSLGVNQLPRLV